MPDQEVTIGKFTRREFREAMAAGRFGAAIVPTGAIEQHLEHLPMDHDIETATRIAVEVARRLYPQAVVSAPMALGISEHHMMHPGTVTAKPGSWLSLLFDAVESLFRHGIRNVLILNGHGGNEAPIYGILRQWQLYFQAASPGSNLQFHSYWNLSREIAERHCSERVPGHAGEYETSMAMALFPGCVRVEAMRDQEERGGLKATEEKGRIFVEAAIEKTAEYLRGMIEGGNREIMPHVFSRDMLPRR